MSLMPATARPFDLIDQEAYVLNGGNSFKVFSLAQTFTPTFATLGFVELGLSCCDPIDPGPVLLRVDIRQGGVPGPVIASSSSFSLAHGATLALMPFVFSPAIPTTPGSTYAIELVWLSGGSGFWSSGNASNPGGSAHIDGSPSAGSDFVFRTGVLSDESPQSVGTLVPAEYSNDFDEQALASGGHGSADPGQVLYSEPPDDAANGHPSDATDFWPGIESGNEPEAQVDALAHGLDHLFDAVVANTAGLVVSVQGDSVPLADGSEVATWVEGVSGQISALHTHAELDASEAPGVVDDIDGIDLWGPAGSPDAFYYSLRDDVLTGTSVFYWDGSASSVYLPHISILGAVVSLGFTGLRSEVDLDAVMIRNIGAPDGSGLGDEILFSIRGMPGTGFDGGEIIRLQTGAPPTFLEHGGHTWDTAFSVQQAIGGDSEEIDALEAVLAPSAVPALELWSQATLMLLLAGLSVPLVRSRLREPISKIHALDA